MAKKFDYDKFIQSMKGWAYDAGGDDAEEVAADGCYDAARDMLKDNKEIAKHLKSLGVTDLVGRLADDLYSVALKK